MTMTLIETKTLGTAAASIEFTSIPQDGTDLVILCSTRSTRAGQTIDTLTLKFNGTTTNYSARYLYGNGATVVSESLTPAFMGLFTTAANATSNTFSNNAITIPNYSGSTNKSISYDEVTENNATTAYQLIGAYLWSNTAAITTLTFAANAGDLVAGTTISLYKITKGSDGIVTTS